MDKQLSMTPDAIRKREKRAAEKQAEFTVLKVGHAFIKGKGTAKPKKDSIWGILVTDDYLVKFFGRRGSAMRFKQEPIASLDAALELYQHKLAGTDAKKLKHEDVAESEQKALLGEDWPQPLFDKYKQALADGKVDLPIVRKPAAWEWPTAAKMNPAATA
jgi:hypothetical protein